MEEGGKTKKRTLVPAYIFATIIIVQEPEAQTDRTTTDFMKHNGNRARPL